MTALTGYLKRAALTVGNIALLAGCIRNQGNSSSELAATNDPSRAIAPETAQQSGTNEAQREAALREALAYSAKQTEDREHGAPLPPSQFPFPNYDAGPGRPVPPNVNFYSINDHYPDYLLCQYDVVARNYNRSDEPRWFKTSLEKIRQLGPKKFPPIKWIAVIIVNRAEWHDASTYEQAHKVGAIFKASDVFNRLCDLSQLVAHVDVDWHPFKYDKSQPTPGDQDRWLIVEQNAGTNHIAAPPSRL